MKSILQRFLKSTSIKRVNSAPVQPTLDKTVAFKPAPSYWALVPIRVEHTVPFKKQAHYNK